MHRKGPNCLRGYRTRRPNSGEDQVPSTGKVHGSRPAADAPIRTELVKRVRRQIKEGTYDTPEKFEAAVARMLDEID